ncbi:MAG: lytic transglycosylase domain-containing protein [Pseudomonadota bacterium]
MSRNISRKWGQGLLLLAGLFAAAVTSAATNLYVYELPDGSRILTDHALNNRQYRLVRMGRDVRGIGHLAAARHPQMFRADPSTYDRLIRENARRYQVDFALVKAIMHVESNFNPYAASNKGALGLMQLMPTTAQRHGITELYDPAQNIEAGVRHIQYLNGLFGDRPQLVIAAYNAGENAVRRHGGIPPYQETQHYVRQVLYFKQHYRRLTTI